MTNEQNAEQNVVRSQFFRHMMTVSHRDYDKPVVELRDSLQNDPDFIGRACVHLATGGTEIRDQVDVAIITLLQAPAMFSFMREAGRVLLLGSQVYKTEPVRLPGLQPFRILRILSYISRSNKKSSRLIRSIARDYLKTLEATEQWFDAIAVMNRKGLTNLYRNAHVKPSDRAQAILFENKPPKGSKFEIIKQIVGTDNAVEKAKLIVDGKIPYRIASTLMTKIDSPAVGVALIGAMSPTEALNSRAWVEQSGLLKMPEVKELYLSKVAKASKSIASADHRKSAQGSDEEVAQAVQQAKQKAVDTAKPIKGDTLMMVDKSGSMHEALSIACEFGKRFGPLFEDDLMVVVHNDHGQVLNIDDRKSVASWDNAFVAQRAGGFTNMQRPFEMALQKGFMPQRILFLTDGGENQGNFSKALQQYAQATGIDPQVTVITIDGHERNPFVQRIEQTGFRLDQLLWTGDYYLLDQVASIMTGEVPKSIIETILEIEYPRRVK